MSHFAPPFEGEWPTSDSLLLRFEGEGDGDGVCNDSIVECFGTFEGVLGITPLEDDIKAAWWLVALFGGVIGIAESPSSSLNSLRSILCLLALWSFSSTSYRVNKMRSWFRDKFWPKDDYRGDFNMEEDGQEDKERKRLILVFFASYLSLSRDFTTSNNGAVAIWARRYYIPTLSSFVTIWANLNAISYLYRALKCTSIGEADEISLMIARCCPSRYQYQHEITLPLRIWDQCNFREFIVRALSVSRPLLISASTWCQLVCFSPSRTTASLIIASSHSSHLDAFLGVVAFLDGVEGSDLISGLRFLDGVWGEAPPILWWLTDSFLGSVEIWIVSLLLWDILRALFGVLGASIKETCPSGPFFTTYDSSSMKI